jgi:hypothetical protein
MREFMDEEIDPQSESGQHPAVCPMLRTKTAFGTFVGHDPWQEGKSSTAVYWCLRTMETVGPDENLAEPQNCCAGRSCYQSPEPES